MATEDLQVRNSRWREGAGGGAGGRWGDGRMSFSYFFCSSPQRVGSLSRALLGQAATVSQGPVYAKPLNTWTALQQPRGGHGMCSCFLDVCTQGGISENTAIVEKNVKILPFQQGLTLYHMYL